VSYILISQKTLLKRKKKEIEFNSNYEEKIGKKKMKTTDKK